LSDTHDPGCPYAAGAGYLPPGVADPSGHAVHLYLCEGLSTYRIGERLGKSRQQAGRMLRTSGIVLKPRGAGRRRSGPDARALDEAMAYLYVRRRLSSEQIARLIGMSGRAVRGRLRAAGVRMRTRGAFNREDRRTVAPSDLASLYLRAGLPAAEVGRMLGLSGPIVLRAAHDHGIPVRLGGPPPCAGPAEIELVEALYADALVQNALARHGIARVAPGGPIWMRFPVPARLAPDAASELYLACGLSLRQIELITGQPSETIRAMLRAQGVTLRPRGGRSPFLRRWRAGQ